MDAYDGLDFTESELARWVDESKSWAFTHGIVIKQNTQENVVTFIPHTLFPSPFPKDLFEVAMTVQKDFQLLYHRVSQDHEFITNSLKNVITNDDFTRRLYDIYDTIHSEGLKTKIYFNITRSDYMLHQTSAQIQPHFQLRQIEMNMIAAGMNGVSTNVRKLHQYMAHAMGERCPFMPEKLPVSDANAELGSCMALVWRRYGNKDSVVVFVVLEGERNRFDQRLLEYAFHQGVAEEGSPNHVPVFYCTLEQIHERGHVTSNNRFLLDNEEVALFYFRAGYSPEHYNENCWKARLMMERSIAVKCPTVSEQLVGTKKVQQVLTAPGMVERFMEDAAAVHRIRSTFARHFSLDPGEEGDAAVAGALSNPSAYVLKPQREGGGNNLYDKQLVQQLQQFDSSAAQQLQESIADAGARSQYILMERVTPPSVSNLLVHPSSSKLELEKIVSELGVVGVYISDEGEEIFNSGCGYLLRSKSVDIVEGGIMSGKAGVDTPYLI